MVGFSSPLFPTFPLFFGDNMKCPIEQENIIEKQKLYYSEEELEEVDIEFCESMAEGQGCKYINECSTYKKLKED